jgi:hypothetical protein
VNTSIELNFPTLGVEPFVLLEFRKGDEDDLRIGLRAGGGIGSNDDIAVALLMALSNLPTLGPFGEALDRVAAIYPEAIALLRDELGLTDA